MRRATRTFVSNLFKSVRNRKKFSPGRITHSQHQFARFCRRNRIEPLESRILLAGDFFRNGGVQYVDSYALAEVLQSSNLDWELAVDLKDPPPTQYTELVHSDASATASFGDALRAIALSHAEATALALTPMNTFTGVPTVSASGIVQGNGGGGYDTTYGDLVGFAENHGVASAHGEYQFLPGDQAQYTFHGTLFVGANGGGFEVGDSTYEFAGGELGAAIAGLGPGCDSAVTMTYDAINNVWLVDGTVAGVPISEGGNNHYYYFECPIAALTQLDLGANGTISSSVSADGPGASASATASFSAGAWGYVTKTSVDTPPGDIDGDGDVDQDDYELWPQPAPGPAPNPNGGNGYVDWAKAAGAIVVTTEVDENGENSADTSLREAIAIAAANPGKDTIVFASWVKDIGLELGQLTISSGNNVSIVNFSDDHVIVDANSASRVLQVNSSAEVQIHGLTITGGKVTGSARGGGINNSGVLTLESVNVTDNTATDTGMGGGVSSTGRLRVVDSSFSSNSANVGGAIQAQSNSTDALVVESSTFYGNHAISHGGAIRTHGSNGVGGGTSRVVNSTFSGNSSDGHAGAIVITATSPPLVIINSTITDNHAATDGGGLYYGGGSITLYNSIVAGNTAAYAHSDDILGSISPLSSNNLLGADESSLPGTNNIFTDNHGLTALADFGGPTLTHALMSDSQARDHGQDSIAQSYGLSSDQRGLDRFVGPNVDIGAFEAGNVNTMTVTSTVDESDGDQSYGDFSLREAIELAAQIPGASVIGFDEDAFETPQVIYLDNGLGQLSIGSDVTINGPGASSLTIDANADNDLYPYRAFLTALNSVVTLRDLTIRGGDLFDKGGGIYSRGDLTLNGVRIIGNSANYGAGIYHENGNLSITDSEIEGNYAVVDVGGIHFDSPGSLLIEGSNIYYNDSDSGTTAGILVVDGSAEVRNSTISFNGHDQSLAGGIVVDNASLLMINSTVAFNSSDGLTGGIYVSPTATAELHNTIVARNIASEIQHDLKGEFVSASSFNFIGFDPDLANGINNGGAESNTVGEASAIDPMLRPAMAYYGGPTKALVLLKDSPAIDAGDNAIAEAYGLTNDQRGGDRIVDWDGLGVDRVDIGAVEMAVAEIFT